MIVQQKATSSSLPPQDAGGSALERKLSIELPTPRQIYTAGSAVSGIIHLNMKNSEQVQEVQVSLLCVVRSYYYRYYGGSTHDFRSETTKLIQQDHTAWLRTDESSVLPSELTFTIVIPEAGHDSKSNNPQTPLPPTFDAGKRRGWKTIETHGTPIGSIKYHIKASVIRKGMFRRNERAVAPFIFLPLSPPPPLLPPTPYVICERDLRRLDSTWDRESATAALRQGLFSSSGQATLALWLPHMASFPRLARIPVFLCLTLHTRRVKVALDHNHPPENVLPPAVQLEKVSLYLQMGISASAKGGKQHHTKVFEKTPSDNLLHDISPLEGGWTLKTAENGEYYWDKEYLWRCNWVFKESPNFANRQLSWEYALVADVPIKGLGNGVKLVSRNLDVTSGVSAGTNVVMSAEQELFDLPPHYFDVEGANDDDDDDDRDEKAKYS